MDPKFRARIEDMIRRSKEKKFLLQTQFLDPSAQQEASALCKARSCRFALTGGFLEAERKMLFLLPDYLEESDIPFEEHIGALRIDSAAPTLKHGDVLGAVLALGIQRSCIGDILLQKLGAKSCATIVSTLPVLGLIESIERVGSYPVTAQAIDLSSLSASGNESRIVKGSVAALRLDSVLSTAFSLARGKSAALIEAGDVSLNWQVSLDKGKSVKEGDTISLRRHGRARLVLIGGHSKKGRIFINLEVWGK